MWIKSEKGLWDTNEFTSITLKQTNPGKAPPIFGIVGITKYNQEQPGSDYVVMAETKDIPRARAILHDIYLAMHEEKKAVQLNSDIDLVFSPEELELQEIQFKHAAERRALDMREASKDPMVKDILQLFVDNLRNGIPMTESTPEEFLAARMKEVKDRSPKEEPIET